MALILLDDILRVVVRVEGVHQDERYVYVVCSVQVLDLAHRQIQEGHAITDLDDGLGTYAAHGRTETPVELQNGQLVEEFDGFRVGKSIVINDLALVWRGNTIPVTARRIKLARLRFL